MNWLQEKIFKEKSAGKIVKKIEFFPCSSKVSYGLLAIAVTLKLVSMIIKPNYRNFSGLLMKGSAIYLVGFFLWNLDNNVPMCEWLRETRKTYPWLTPVLQFHALWHLFTATGTHYLLVKIHS